MHGVDIEATVETSPSVPETSVGGAHGHAVSTAQHDVFGRRPTSKVQLPPCNRIRKSSGSALTLTTARSRRIEPIPFDRCVVEGPADLSHFVDGGKA
jgi:hypothetical protein